MATSDHIFEALHSQDAIAAYVIAACSCGWVAPYTHAFEQYALADWWHHIDMEG